MSEHSLTIVRLDVVATVDSEAIPAGVRDLLLARGVIAPNDRRDALWQPSEWKPGPDARAALEAADGYEVFLELANNGVDIRLERTGYHPTENDETPRCTRCGASAPAAYTDLYGSWLDEWTTTGREPQFACDDCGWSGPVGDWTGQFSVLVGAPAVTFHNWPPLKPTVVSDLRTALGGRTGVVASHW